MNSLKVVSELVCLPLSAHSLEGREPRAAGRKEGGPAAWATGVFFLTQSPSSEANRREDHGEAFLPSLPPSPPLLPHSFLHGGSGIRQAAEAVPRGGGHSESSFCSSAFCYSFNKHREPTLFYALLFASGHGVSLGAAGQRPRLQEMPPDRKFPHGCHSEIWGE